MSIHSDARPPQEVTVAGPTTAATTGGPATGATGTGAGSGAGSGAAGIAGAPSGASRGFQERVLQLQQEAVVVEGSSLAVRGSARACLHVAGKGFGVYPSKPEGGLFLREAFMGAIWKRETLQPLPVVFSSRRGGL